MKLYIKLGARYKEASADMVQEAVGAYLDNSITGEELTTPAQSITFLQTRLGLLEREHFCILFLDTRNRVIEFNPMFKGTINKTNVHPREVIKRALALNCSAVILAHNHPSGRCEPSEPDKRITQLLKEALEIVDIRLLDHFIVSGTDYTSMAERGLI